VRRRPKHRHRIPLGRRTLRSLGQHGGGSRPQAGRRVVRGLLSGRTAAKAATTTIPIVFIVGSDPIDGGLVATLNRPGGNLTGVAQFTNALIAKRLELLRELVPGVALIGVLMYTDNPNTEINARDVQAAARTVGQQILIAGVDSRRGFGPAFAMLAQHHAGAL